MSAKLTFSILFVATIALTTWQIAAADATPARKPLNLPAELPSATGYTTADVIPAQGMNLRFPTCIAFAPGDNDRMFIVEKLGRVLVVPHFGAPKPQAHLFLDVNALLKAKNASLAVDSEMGVLGLAFHPNFAENGAFFLTYDFAIQENGKQVRFDRLSRFNVSRTNPDEADPASEAPLITQVDRANNHNGGDIHFGTDGYLYLSNGDEGGGNDNFDNARFIDKSFFAGIFRLDVDCKPLSLPPNPHTQASSIYPSAVNPGTYRIPPDNPFIGAATHHGKKLDPAKIRTEFWASGFRNPWRFTFDPPTGRMFVGDIGQDRWEEIDIAVRGGDYGWSFREGNHDGPRKKDSPVDATTLIPPIYDYPHHEGSPEWQGASSIGGVIYRGSALTELFGQYIFSDFGTRHFWSLRQDGDKWKITTLISRDEDVSAFAVDPRNGDLLMACYGAGKIRKLVRTGTTGPKPPELLSQTGAFEDLAALNPAAGLMAYTPAVSFWSDYAIKSRWFRLPDSGGKITFNRDGNWTFPTGTTWVKHFDLETRRGDPASRRRLETRFLVKTAEGCYGLTYKWRADQSDADLVPESGLDETFDVLVDGNKQKQTWHYPSRTDCLTCHTSVAGFALGFNSRQLAGQSKVGDRVVDQLQVMSDAGCFTEPVKQAAPIQPFAKADDASQPLEWRVRSYFAVNCVQCHQPGGGAPGNWDARPTTPLTTAAIVDGNLVNELGNHANRFAAPGDAVHSMVLRRLAGQGVPRMPPLATNELDPADTALLKQWIAQLRPAH